MLYFINPRGKKPRAVKARAIPKRTRRKLRRAAARVGQKWFGVNPASGVDTRGTTAPGSPRPKRTRKRGGSHMARRRRNRKGQFTAGGGGAKRRRRRRATASAPRRRVTRRRRRRVTAYASNPVRRRRRSHRRRHAVARRRRRYSRNPSVRGIVGSVVQGAKDGGAVFAGQVIARKFRGAVTGMLPDDQKAKVLSGAGLVGLSIAGAVITGMVARMALPGYARLITAGAFAEAINTTLSQQPTIAKYLGAFPVRRVAIAPNGRGMLGYPQRSGYNVPAGRAGVGAWPVRSPGLPTQVG